MKATGISGNQQLYPDARRCSDAPLRNALLTLVSVLVISLMSSSCAVSPAPVSDLPQPPSERVTYHVVSPGDTLLSIAWSYEKDVEALAQSNGLAPPYQLVAGQRLTLNTTDLKPVPLPQSRTAPVKSGSANTFQKDNKPVSQASRATTQARVDKKPEPIITTTPAKTVGSAAPFKLPTGEINWRWPVNGAVSRQYDTSKVFKGINIQSLPGQAVKAAGSGVVVYAGSGLRGYGKLIIIKHSDIYLSAYAHNEALLINEGDVVKAGQDISTVGGDPNNRGRLYFEVRKSGKPVDPMRLLPRQ